MPQATKATSLTLALFIIYMVGASSTTPAATQFIVVQSIVRHFLFVADPALADFTSSYSASEEQSIVT